MTNAHETKLREAFRNMDAHQAQEIRASYYKAIEGLRTLAETLEIADIPIGEANDHALIEEHLIVCEAIEAMKNSLLGRILSGTHNDFSCGCLRSRRLRLASSRTS
ncbi:hypothetical protein [Blastopirellula retiformator]|uniref:Uncharacterized protein n=1 Tax=Blastopirellula retiformator TaxID=2527970 RepID=A0A5C5UW91_9BACT|nr:hypothetical protein [Blastopirellula retiformator]TWT30139.1 hypothetical protein Enr8_47980 [Blastopirellula retiformator]